MLFVTASAYAHGVSEQAKQRMIDGGPLDFALAGAGHILTGHDHLLLLLGAVFVLRRALDVLKFATLFTAGHTVTLLGATVLHLGIDHRLVDAIVAATVIGIAAINIRGAEDARGWLLLAAPAFGLIHGLGLAAGIEEMTIPGDPALWTKLVTFNVGVEVGQVTALAFAMAILAAWRGCASWRSLRTASNWAICVAGATLLGQQIVALATG